MSENKVFLSNFEGEDDCAKITAAMAYLREHPGAILEIEPGEYHITTELARKTQDECMRGVYGANPEPVMFTPNFEYSRVLDFDGQKDTTVIARGAKFIIDGFLEPVSIRNCEGCTLEGLTVDTVRKPYSVGKIFNCTGVGTKQCYFDVRFYDEYPIYENTPALLRNYYVNPVKNRLDYDGMYDQQVKYIEPQVLRFYGSNLPDNIDGYDYYVWHTYHYRPSLLIDHAKNTIVRDYTVNSHPGMGILGNRSENILLEGIKDVPCEGSWVASNTDATHFTACTGDLIMRGCTFIGQGDDATNVHGYYHTIMRHEGCTATTSVLHPTRTHSQTLDYPEVGDTMELSRVDTLEVIDTYKVVAVVPRESDWESDITFDRELPENTDGLFLFDVDRLPNLVFENNVDKDHFARGVLIKCRSAVVRGNYFENVMGNAVCAYSEAAWHEGTTIANVLIENNRIVNCGYAGEGVGVSGVDIGCVSEFPPEKPVNKNVTVRNNSFEGEVHGCAIRMRYTDGVLIENNNYVGRFNDGKILVDTCKNVKINE